MLLLKYLISQSYYYIGLVVNLLNIIYKVRVTPNESIETCLFYECLFYYLSLSCQFVRIEN